MESEFVLWSRDQELASLAIRPLLASWEAAHHPAQRRLAAYLERVRGELSLHLSRAEGPLYLEVRTPVPDGLDPLAGHDLENYLTPLAQALRPAVFVLACATKGTQDAVGDPRIAVGTARAAGRPQGGDWFRCQARSSTARPAWKDEIRDSLLGDGAAPLPPGPIDLEIAVRCSGTRRNWVNLWKPLGDALGPLLGEPDPRRPFHPADDRVTALRLHHEACEDMGYDVDAAVRAVAAPA